MQTTTTPVLPDLDPALGQQLGDEILLGAAKVEKVAKVKSTNGSPNAVRAWTLGGNVD